MLHILHDFDFLALCSLKKSEGLFFYPTLILHFVDFIIYPIIFSHFCDLPSSCFYVILTLPDRAAEGFAAPQPPHVINIIFSAFG